MSVLILLIVSILLFLVLHVLPVDPAAMSLPPTATIADIEAMRREMGLDLPLPQQYLIWLSHVIHADFGNSIHFRRSVAQPGRRDVAGHHRACRAVDGHCRGARYSRRLVLFHVRGSRKEPIADLGSIMLLSIPEFLWASVLHFDLWRRPAGAAFHRAARSRNSGCRTARVPAVRCAGRRPAGYLLERAQAYDPAVLRARHCFLAGHHAGAALEPDRRLSGRLYPSCPPARPDASAVFLFITRSRTPFCRRSA